MEHRISATDLARRLGDVLSRVRYRNDSFVVERNGEPIARLAPLAGGSTTVREALAWWAMAVREDTAFIADLERIRAADAPPENPWAS